MTSIEFHNFRSNDLGRSFPLEDAWQRFGAWSGIHDYAFDDLFADDSIVVTGLEAATWTVHTLDVAVPANFSIRYHTTQYQQGVFFSGPEGISFMIGTDADGTPTVWDGTGVIRQQVPGTAPLEADVEVVFRQQVLSDTGSDIWLTLTLYMNGAWVTTFSQSISGTTSEVAIHLLAYDTDVVTYTDVRIPELCETTEFGTLDPGEAAFSGLQRTIEGRYLKYFVRYDGSLRVWRKKARDTALTLETSVESLRHTTDLTQLLTHARMMGAYIWGEAVDSTLLGEYGHRFNELNNPMLLTEEECDVEAANSLKRSEEAAFGLTFQAQHVPVLEPEDRISVNEEEWVINDLSYEVSEGQIAQSYTARRYVWGDA